MKSPSPRPETLEQFSGIAPVFPLPDVVAFPNSILPLHIFEERYRTLISDLLAGPRWLALALLRPGWEARYETREAPVHSMVCLGRVTHVAPLGDGRFNILFQGVTRARIVDEPCSNSPYRIAQLERQTDLLPHEPSIDRARRVHELIAEFRMVVPEIDLDHVWHQTVATDLPLGGVCDILSHALSLPVGQAQQLLDETNVDLRSDLLLDRLRDSIRVRCEPPAPSDFPPNFSVN